MFNSIRLPLIRRARKSSSFSCVWLNGSDIAMQSIDIQCLGCIRVLISFTQPLCVCVKDIDYISTFLR